MRRWSSQTTLTRQGGFKGQRSGVFGWIIETTQVSLGDLEGTPSTRRSPHSRGFGPVHGHGRTGEGGHTLTGAVGRRATARNTCYTTTRREASLLRLFLEGTAGKGLIKMDYYRFFIKPKYK